MSEIIKRTCWCYTTERHVCVDGKIVERRQADVLQISECIVNECPQRSSRACLIGKTIEGKWAC